MTFFNNFPIRIFKSRTLYFNLTNIKREQIKRQLSRRAGDALNIKYCRKFVNFFYLKNPTEYTQPKKYGDVKMLLCLGGKTSIGHSTN